MKIKIEWKNRLKELEQIRDISFYGWKMAIKYERS